jgi:hypothetical protein
MTLVLNSIPLTLYVRSVVMLIYDMLKVCHHVYRQFQSVTMVSSEV